MALAADSTSAIRFWQGTLSVIKNYFSCGKLLSNLLASQLRHLYVYDEHGVMTRVKLSRNRKVGGRYGIDTYFHVLHL